MVGSMVGSVGCVVGSGVGGETVNVSVKVQHGISMLLSEVVVTAYSPGSKPVTVTVCQWSMVML